jgi:hypothetical protein
MGTRHVPLGYPDWGLWALPLEGRAVGEFLIEQNTFRTPIDDELRIVCADLYALYVMGPSYPVAAVFLELDPDDEDEEDGVSDVMRCQLLLEKLPQIDPAAEDDLAAIAEQVRRPWEEARRAVGGRDVRIDPAAAAVVDEFFAELRTERKALAFPTLWLDEAKELGSKLLAGGAELDGVAPTIRDLVTALWLARLKDPMNARRLHERARTVARRRPSGSRAADPTRTSRQKVGA